VDAPRPRLDVHRALPLGTHRNAGVAVSARRRGNARRRPLGSGLRDGLFLLERLDHAVHPTDGGVRRGGQLLSSPARRRALGRGEPLGTGFGGAAPPGRRPARRAREPRPRAAVGPGSGGIEHAGDRRPDDGVYQGQRRDPVVRVSQPHGRTPAVSPARAVPRDAGSGRRSRGGLWELEGVQLRRAGDRSRGVRLAPAAVRRRDPTRGRRDRSAVRVARTHRVGGTTPR